MENAAAKRTAEYFEKQGLHFERVGASKEGIISTFSAQNAGNIKLLMVFDPDAEGVRIRTVGLFKVPEDGKEKAYRICNEMNCRFRWIKFYLDESDNTIIAQDDAVIDPETCGSEVLRCCAQLTKIADSAFPLIE